MPSAANRSRTCFSCRERVRTAYQSGMTSTSGTAPPSDLQITEKNPPLSAPILRKAGKQRRISCRMTYRTSQRHDLFFRNPLAENPSVDLLPSVQVGNQQCVKLPVR